ncbi:TetR/AcrR family transcriptional regulator [Paenibacillus albicereus]|uniref:TetR/AcrR family transcriptional regulator n=1 Tax=Paenibacillus albicereus TaxID=2726185 RepID=A0A6H2GZ27_9BACL|nr:TetR/AcrR family transcriptional regulator [Paenibacillus albicereus]QJC52599.1 TetR/AcrR family transcriptional regulator [Paenibacillus albicereus]
METPLDRRARRTREALQQAYIRLMLEKKAATATIQEIAEAADYNRGTFYNHYAGKEELLEEIRSEFLRRFSELLLAPYPGRSGVGAEEIYPSSLMLFEHVERSRETFLALLATDAGLAGAMSRVLREAMKRDLRLSLEGEHLEVDHDFMLHYRASATIGTLLYWAETDFKYSASYMARQLMLQLNHRLDYIAFNPTSEPR